MISTEVHILVIIQTLSKQKILSVTVKAAVSLDASCKSCKLLSDTHLAGCLSC